MGTTATCLLLDLPYALIAHVGDSRAYLLRGRSSPS
jgi:serine/threonine protein phosphatase PrpC